MRVISKVGLAVWYFVTVQEKLCDVHDGRVLILAVYDCFFRLLTAASPVTWTLQLLLQ